MPIAAAKLRHDPPPTPWIMRQTWYDLLFAHWPLPPRDLAPLVPPPLELDTFDGEAWLGVVPFAMRGIRFRGLPPIPTANAFLELNVRTYVTYRGRSGVLFLSLDAVSGLAVRGARLLYKLPYHRAAIELRRHRGEFDFRSRRLVRGVAPPEFIAAYRPVGEASSAPPGSLLEFLTERYSLYVVHRGRVSRADVRHRPWNLCPAEVEIARNSMTEPLGIRLAGAPLAHFAEEVETWVGPLRG